MEKEGKYIKERIFKLHSRIMELESRKKACEADGADAGELQTINEELERLNLELKKAVLTAAGMEDKLDQVKDLDITIL